MISLAWIWTISNFLAHGELNVHRHKNCFSWYAFISTWRSVKVQLATNWRQKIRPTTDTLFYRSFLLLTFSFEAFQEGDTVTRPCPVKYFCSRRLLVCYLHQLPKYGVFFKDTDHKTEIFYHVSIRRPFALG